jgi:Zn-dependent peptidase ImmA (M78 family)
VGKKPRFIQPAEIERTAEGFITRCKIAKPPVPVEQIAGALGLSIEYVEVGNNVSGVLVMSGNTGTIGVNKNNPHVRQRFSIAHEIAHYCLHRDSSDLFIDDNFNVQFRDDESSTGEKRKEIQANMLAASLLMPRSLLAQEIERGHFDLADDTQLAQLAGLFEVSVAAMTYRITGLLSPSRRPRAR